MSSPKPSRSVQQSWHNFGMRLKNLRRTSLKPESYWPIGWTSGIKDIKSQISARTRRCPMNGGSISISSKS